MEPRVSDALVDTLAREPATGFRLLHGHLRESFGYRTTHADGSGTLTDHVATRGQPFRDDAMVVCVTLDRDQAEAMLLRALHARASELRDLLPERPLNAWFLEVVGEGTGRHFTPEANADWCRTTRPILEAFFHARFFLEMAIRYSDLAEPPRPLPSGYAVLLYLYDLRGQRFTLGFTDGARSQPVSFVEQYLDLGKPLAVRASTCAVNPPEQRCAHFAGCRFSRLERAVLSISSTARPAAARTSRWTCADAFPRTSTSAVLLASCGISHRARSEGPVDVVSGFIRTGLSGLNLPHSLAERFQRDESGRPEFGLNFSGTP